MAGLPQASFAPEAPALPRGTLWVRQLQQRLGRAKQSSETSGRGGPEHSSRSHLPEHTGPRHTVSTHAFTKTGAK